MAQTVTKVFRNQADLLVEMIIKSFWVQMNYLVNGVMFLPVGADVNL